MGALGNLLTTTSSAASPPPLLASGGGSAKSAKSGGRRTGESPPRAEGLWTFSVNGCRDRVCHLLAPALAVFSGCASAVSLPAMIRRVSKDYLSSPLRRCPLKAICRRRHDGLLYGETALAHPRSSSSGFPCWSLPVLRFHGKLKRRSCRLAPSATLPHRLRLNHQCVYSYLRICHLYRYEIPFISTTLRFQKAGNM